MRIGWLCKHGKVTGIIDPPANTTLHKLREMVRLEHFKVCKVSGVPWILIDTEGDGELEPDGCSICIEVGSPDVSGPRLIILHVQ